MTTKNIIIAGFAIIILAGLLLVSGNAQPAQADKEDTAISINLSMSDIKLLFGEIKGLFVGEQTFGGSSDSGYNATGDGVYAVDGTTVIDGSGNVDAPITSTTGTFSSTLTVSGALTSNIPFQSTTSIANAATLSQSDLTTYRGFYVGINTAEDHTWTLPATSTMTTLLPNSGDKTEFCFYNATSSDHDLILAAGTGWDLESATSSLYIHPTMMGCVEAVRLPSTDIWANVLLPNEAD